MRILLLGSGLLDTHTRRFLQMLLQVGHTVIYVGKEDPKPEGTEHYTFIRSPEFTWLKLNRPYRLIQFLKEWGIALKLRYIWHQVKPDIGHLIFIDALAYHCSLAQLHPLVLTALGGDINNLFQIDNLDTRLREKIIKALQEADHVTADSFEVLKQCDLLAGRSLNSTLFYFGVDLNLFKSRSIEEKQSLRRKLGIPPDCKIILSPRRIKPKMRHDLVLRACAEVYKKKKLDVVLVLRRFGNMSKSLEQDLRKLAEELDISDRLFWVDEMDYTQLPLLYGLADVVINFPEQDGLPVTLFEVSACLTPVITSDLSSYQEYLSEGAYFRVPAGNVNSLVDSIECVLCESNEGMKEILQKNYDLVVNKANQEKCFTVIEQIYKKLV